MKTARKRVLVLSFSPLDRDPRVRRQLEFLKQTHDVTAAGFTDPCMDWVRFVPLENSARTRAGRLLSVALLQMRQYERFYWSHPRVLYAVKQLENLPCDVVLANDLEALPLACRLARRASAKVFFDAHEYAPREFEDLLVFRMFFSKYRDALCRRYLSQADAMTTVGQGIKEEYEKVYGVQCGVITNAPAYARVEPSPVAPGAIRMVHHGMANRSRRLENMVSLAERLDERFSLDMILVNSDPPYFKKLLRQAAHLKKVRILPPVPFKDIGPVLQCYDVGLFLLYPVNFNYQHALPNKLFEFMHAGLAVAVWPSPEMKRVVEQYGCGVAGDDFSVTSMARRLNGLSSQDVERFKQKSCEAAKDLCAQKNKEKFLEIIHKLVGEP